MTDSQALAGSFYDGRLSSEVRAARKILEDASAVARLLNKDASLYGPEVEVIQRVSRRLGWVDLAESMGGHLDDITAFAQKARQDGLTHVLLLGMGGSSLAPLVFADVFGKADGGMALEVLDSSSPDAVRRVERTLPLDRTLILVSSKSGTTAEPRALAAYFRKSLEERLGSRWKEAMAAITDPDTPLAEEAEGEGWRKVFLNPPDLGGRYSALSDFGLVPLALLGHDPARLLASAGEMLRTARDGDGDGNPALRLGSLLGAAYLGGRDRITFLGEGPARSFPLWLEQLLAESTGKDGKGLLPVAMEPPRRTFRQDRVFVAFDESTPFPQGHPSVAFRVRSPWDLGREMLRFEMGVALSGVVMGLNPFDEPNVAESKANTQRILAELDATSPLPGDGVPVREGARRIRRLIGKMQPGAYLQIGAYLDPGAGLDGSLLELREAVATLTDIPITWGYGPRFLHSTGQYHKGGRPVGGFVQLVSDSAELPIPGLDYGFQTLIRAQAEGDREALERRGFPVVTVSLGKEAARGLSELVVELA